jgi:hypothetical protein
VRIHYSTYIHTYTPTHSRCKQTCSLGNACRMYGAKKLTETSYSLLHTTKFMCSSLVTPRYYSCMCVRVYVCVFATEISYSLLHTTQQSSNAQVLFVYVCACVCVCICYRNLLQLAANSQIHVQQLNNAQDSDPCAAAE